MLSSRCCHDNWKAILSKTSEDSERTEARMLIVELAVLEQCSFLFRFMHLVRSFPMLLLLLLEKEPGVVDECRQSVAHQLRGAAPCCLRAPAPYLKIGYSDVSWKLLGLYEAEFGVVAATGKVPTNLYAALLVFRSTLRIDSQAAEGMHVVLQGMRRAAPLLGHALASDRLQLKLADPISPAECCAFHHLTMAEMGSQTNVHRFHKNVF